MSVTKTSQVSSTEGHNPSFGNPPIGTVTSSFFVSIDDLFASAAMADNTESDLGNAVQLLWFTSREERISIGNMTSDFLPSATLIHSLLEMHVMTDSAMPDLRQALRNNDCIDTITITRIGHLGNDNTNTPLYQSTFNNCFLESIEEFPDKLVINARICQRYDEAAATDYTGPVTTIDGQSGSGWDYQKNMDYTPSQ